jgi:S1-C subfamily serine protease
MNAGPGTRWWLAGIATVLVWACAPDVAQPPETGEHKKVVVKAAPPRTQPRPVVLPPTGDVVEDWLDVLTDDAPAPAPTFDPLDGSPVEVGEAEPALASGLPDFATVYQRVVPSVVKIATFSQRRGLAGAPWQPLADGTGFFFGNRGEIITNAHVVADAQRIEVTTLDGRTLPARLLGLESRTDLALLAVEMEEPPPSLTTLPEEDVRPGLWVLAIGNPLGLDFSASHGIISAVNRDDVVWDGFGYWDFIQTDAAINEGNSGGPLVDRYGRLVGITTAVNRGGQRIAYAIPVSMIDITARHLRRYGKLRRASLGIQIQEREGRLEVVGVFPDSPAYFAGFKPGDIIVELDGTPPESVPQIRWDIAIHSLEEVAQFELERDGIRLMVGVQLEPALSDPNR